MTEPTSLLVVLGIDGEGKPRASRFSEGEAELAARAATLLGFRFAWIRDEAGLAIARALPEGNVFARGNGFVRTVRQSVFERLSAFLDGAVVTNPSSKGSDAR